MNKLILTDCDNVLLDWNAGFDTYMSEQGIPRVPNTDIHYSLGKRFGMNQKEALEHAMAFNRSDNIRNLKPYMDVERHVYELAQCGYKFIVITSMSRDPSAIANRKTNLRDVFGDCMVDVHGLEHHESKQYVLREWADSGHFWIEDHFKNAEAGYEEGLRPILVTTEYNAGYHTDLFPRTSLTTPWADISARILTDEKNNLR